MIGAPSPVQVNQALPRSLENHLLLAAVVFFCCSTPRAKRAITLNICQDTYVDACGTIWFWKQILAPLNYRT